MELSDGVRWTKRHSRGGRVVTFALSQTDTVREAGAFKIRPETAHACMTHETQKRPRLSLLFSTLLNSQKISFSSSEETPPLVWLLLRTSLSTDFLQTLGHRHRNTRDHPRTRNTRDFTNKQATCKRKIYFRVALKRTIVKIRKEISNLNRTTDPNNGLQRTDFGTVIGKI